jgi:hypothetical protein
MIRFLLHPPGWPARKLRICRCHWSALKFKHNSVHSFTFWSFAAPPPGPCAPMPACPRSRRPQRRPQRRSSSELAGAFPPFGLGSWQRLPAAQWSGQRRCLGGIGTWKLTPGVDRLRPASWGCPRNRREQWWLNIMVLTWLRMLIGDVDVTVTKRIFHSVPSHCVLWIDWINSIVCQPTSCSFKVHWEPSVRMKMPNGTVHLSLRIPLIGL